MKYIDLHVHSKYSDGTLTPKAIVHLAAQTGLSAIALTDHDTVAGVSEAKLAGKECSLLVLSGIEISAVHEDTEIHILGLNVDENKEAFVGKLKEYQEERIKRNERMIGLLAEQGFKISKEALYERYPDAIITRAHFAAYLAEQGDVKNRTEAFDQYLNPGCPCYLPKKEITVEEAMDTIRLGDGHAVLAHPLQYKLSQRELESLVRLLIPHGLEGIEAIYSAYSEKQQRSLRQLAKKFNLYITGGSDFHGANKPDIQLGTGYGNLKVDAGLLTPIL